MNLREVFSELSEEDKTSVAKAILVLNNTGFLNEISIQNKEHMLSAVREVAHQGDSHRFTAGCVRFNMMEEFLRTLHDLTSHLDKE
jgi:hypothetical protein